MTDVKPPMSASDAMKIVDVVEARLRIHLADLKRYSREDGLGIYVENPANERKVVLFETFMPETHGCVGYRIWTLEAIPELLSRLLQPKKED